MSARPYETTHIEDVTLVEGVVAVTLIDPSPLDDATRPSRRLLIFTQPAAELLMGRLAGVVGEAARG